MQCAACLSDNPSTHNFCENCGVDLRPRCAACGHANALKAKFCGECGTALTRSPALGVTASSPVPPAATSAPADTVWAELKQATMVFADIVSSTEHVSGLDPEQAMEHLGPAVLLMCKAIESFGGTVVRTLGDGVMAVFGVPRTLERHALLACEAALAMQASFLGNEQGLRIRVGLHSGLVASDPSGHDVAIGGGVFGHAVHLASRVVGLAEPGGICLTAATLSVVQTQVTTRSMGLHRLKGVTDAVEIHVLLDLKPVEAGMRFQSTGLSSFRGRDAQLAQMQEALRRAQTGTGVGVVIGVSGAPGSGKSRLSHEFAQWARRSQVPVVEVRTQPYGYATPLLPVLSLLRSWIFNMGEKDTPAQSRQRITEGLAALGPVEHNDLSLLSELLGLMCPEISPCSLEPRARRARLLELVRALVRETGQTPAVIVFEDLHWLDAASEVILSAMVEELAATRVVMLLNYRPSYQAPWTGLAHFQPMSLAELSPEEIEALVRELLVSRSELLDVLPAIVQRSAGNPFFAEELVHSLVEMEPLSDQRDGPQRSLASVVNALPATVQAVIGERIDRLYASQKTLLHICAVIGKEIALPVLQRVAVYMAGHLETGLSGLCEADLLQLLRAVEESRRYAFRHPLIQEVAYSTQLKTRRAEVHGSVAIAMASYFREHLDEYAALIAHHFEAAGQWVEAARYEAKAAQWLGVTNSTQAMVHWRRARALLLSQPRSVDVDQLRVKIGGGLVYLGWREGMTADEVRQVVHETVDRATEVDSRLVQLMYLIEGRILHGTGEPADRYVDKMLAAIGIGAGAADLGRQATMHTALSQAYRWSGLLHEGIAASDVAMQGIDVIDKRDCDFFGFDVRQWAWSIRIRLLIGLMRLDEARECLNRLTESIQPSDDPIIRNLAYQAMFDVGTAVGDDQLVAQGSAAVAHIVALSSSPYSKACGFWSAGLVQLYAGNWVHADRDFVEAHNLIRATGVALEMEAEVLACLAECRFKAGVFDMALVTAQEAVALSQRRGNRLAECRALIVWGGSLARLEVNASSTQALPVLQKAQQLLQITGAKFHEEDLLHELAFATQ